MVATGPSPSPPGSSPRDGDGRGSRPLSTPAAIGIAGLVAVIVIGVGVLIVERIEPSRLIASDAIAPIPPVAAPPSIAPTGHGLSTIAAPPIAVPPIAAPPIAAHPAANAAPPVSTGTAQVAAAPVPSTAAGAPPVDAASATPSAPPAAASALSAPLPPAKLPPQLGYLAVRGQSEARVYVNGVDIGPTNQALETLCGLRYVRIGTLATGGSPPTWFGPGQSVAIGCRALTEISAHPAP